MLTARGLRVLVLTLAAALAVAAPAAASDLKQTLQNCEPGTSLGQATRPSSVCVVLTSGLRAFSNEPGITHAPSIRTVSATAVNGYVRAKSADYARYMWSDWFSNATNASGYVDGTWTVGPEWPGPIGKQTIDLHVSGDPADAKYVSCPNVSYIVCEVARTTGTIRGKDRYAFSVVRLTTRPLIIRIVNQTDHTLERTSPSALATNLLHDTQIADPVTIPSYDAAAPNANIGWYHYYRYAVRAGRGASFDATYTLRAAAQSNLARATVRIMLAMKADGTDDNSRCVADDRFATYLQCSVMVAGSPSGQMIATVYVAQ